MKSFFRGAALFLALAFGLGLAVNAASIATFTGPMSAGDIQYLLNQLVLAINQNVTPQSMAPWAGWRNYVDNGAMGVAQRGTGATVGGVHTSGCTAAVHVADRWCVDTNVTSGAGKGQVVTSTPSPPLGFTNVLKVWRDSGDLTQPVCVLQEIPTSEVVQLAGQQAVLSFYAQALAGLSADNGNAIKSYIMTGTGTDQGLGTMTNAPAVTPAWTGIASATTASHTLSASAWNRYTLTGTIPAAAKEAAVAVCFTPTATGAGATDGFAITGVQLEQGMNPSVFEFRPYGVELAKAQQYYWQVTDGAATLAFPATCAETTSGTVAACTWIFPATMRAAPTVVVGTATSFGMTKAADGTAEACSTLALIASSATVNSVGLTCAASETAAVGTMHRMIGGTTSGILSASADF